MIRGLIVEREEEEEEQDEEQELADKARAPRLIKAVNL
jgi:hypothetical protein